MVVLNNVSAKIYLRTEHLTLGTPLSPPQLVTPLCRDLFVVHSRVLSSSTVIHVSASEPQSAGHRARGQETKQQK